MAVQITQSVIIKGQPEEVFNLWNDIELFPSIIKDIKEVEKIDELVSRWVVEGPFGKEYEWTAQITRFDEDRRIAWKTVDGDIKTSGQVTFKDLPKSETEVTLSMQYVPPAGKVGDVVSKVMENPQKKISESLRDFKAYVEDMPERIRKNKKRSGEING
jgi:uncharacterized membrane protein